MRIRVSGNTSYPFIRMHGTTQTSYRITPDGPTFYIENASYSESDVYTISGSSKVKSTSTNQVFPYYYIKKEVSDDLGWSEISRPIFLIGNGTKCVVTDSSDNTFSLEFPVENRIAKVYNLIPNRTYTWQILDNSNNVVTSGSFTTTGTTRMIRIPVIHNFRDIGGWDYYDDNNNLAGKLKFGKLFRSFGITYDNGSGRSILGTDTDIINNFLSINIKKDLDLRSSGTGHNYASDPNYPSDTITYVNAPISAYGIVTATSGFTALKTALDEIGSSIVNGDGVWAHCYTGADRTGVMIGIIMAICGCTVDSIIKEYELTCFNSPCYHVKLDDDSSIRDVLFDLYNKTGDTLKEKTVTWLTDTVGVSSTTISNIQAGLCDTSQISPVSVTADVSDFNVYSISDYNTLNADSETLYGVNICLN